MFKPKSLDKILAGFQQTINDLKDLANHHGEHITNKTNLICDLQQEITAHDAEKLKAAAIQKNLENLLSV